MIHVDLAAEQTENGLVEAVAVLVSKMPRLRPSLPEGAPGVAYSFKPEFSKARVSTNDAFVMLLLASFG